MTTINELLTNFKNLVKKYHYTKTEVDTALADKASKDAATTETAGLMTAADKVKLNGIDTGATATTVDSSLSDSSENPVQNKVVKDALDDKADASDLATVATSGSYEDLEDVPESFTPSSHTHGNLTNDGKVGSTSGKPLITGTNGVVEAGEFGITSGTFAEGDHTHSQYLTQHQDISGKEDSSNKVNSWSSTTTNTHYPTEKLVKDSLDEKISKSQTIGLVKNDGTIDTTVYLDVDSADNISNLTDGIYLLASSSDSTPKLKLHTVPDDMDTLVDLYPFNYYVSDHHLGDFTVNWGDGTIETIGDYGDYTHTYSTHDEYVIEIDWFDGVTSIDNNGGYDSGFGFNSTDIYKIELPYGITSLVSGDLVFGCSELSIPKTVTSISSDLFSNDYSIQFILHWDTSDTILQNVFDENATFSIPYGTTSLYTAKGYPSAKLTERAEETVSASTELYIKKDGEVIEIMSKDDVEDLLDTKLDAADTFSGSYNDLTNKPDIPTKTSDLTNDGDGTNAFLTEHQSLTNYVQKSSTTGLIKNDGTIDTTTYLSSHQDISGKENSSNKVSSWSGTTTDDHYPSEKLVKDSLDLKANSSSLATVATSGSYADLSNIPSTFTPATHGHSASEITDSTAHAAIGSAANATQANINTLIDSKISSLLNVELITIESTRPTASASTMNKLYLIPESSGSGEDNYEVFVTVKVNNTYSWEKIDTARLDLSGYYTKTQADNTFVKQEDFIDSLNTITTNLLNAE